jgi:hypothetical protein
MARQPLLVVLAVIVVALLAVVLVVTTQMSTSHTNSIAPCKDSFNEPLFKGLNGLTAIGAVLLTNSTSMVCVHYTDGIHSEIAPVVRRLVNGSYTQTSSISVTSVQVNASYVAYSMTITKATKGIFNIELPIVCYGPEIFLAVGYGFHALNDTTLRVPLEQTACPASSGIGNVVGTTNLEVGWVRMELVPSTS